MLRLSGIALAGLLALCVGHLGLACAVQRSLPAALPALSRASAASPRGCSTTFTSVRAMARRMWVPGFPVRDPFDDLSVPEAFQVPVLIVHGERSGRG